MRQRTPAADYRKWDCTYQFINFTHIADPGLCRFLYVHPQIRGNSHDNHPGRIRAGLSMGQESTQPDARYHLFAQGGI